MLLVHTVKKGMGQSLPQADHFGPPRRTGARRAEPPAPLNRSPTPASRPVLLAPLTVLVASGSWVMRHHPAQLVLAGLVAAVALPILLLVRQWLGWTYVHRRLLSERVEYEESGWYDGQVWEKPLAWRQQDLLVAQHQVQPVLRRLQQAAMLAVILALVGASLCQAL